MKDLPHHIKKLNRRVIRSMHREEMEEELLPEIPAQKETVRQKKKKAKNAIKKTKEARTPTHPSLEERNKVMKKGRVPIFDRNNAKPKRARSTKKKTPRI